MVWPTSSVANAVRIEADRRCIRERISMPRSDIKDRKVIAEHDGDPAPELLAVKMIMSQSVWGGQASPCAAGGGVCFEPAAPTETARDVVIPYGRGDLVSRVHADGRVRQTEHIAGGTRIRARVPAAPAALGNDAGRQPCATARHPETAPEKRKRRNPEVPALLPSRLLQETAQVGEDGAQVRGEVTQVAEAGAQVGE
jgi:hypothetical protein